MAESSSNQSIAAAGSVPVASSGNNTFLIIVIIVILGAGLILYPRIKSMLGGGALNAAAGIGNPGGVSQGNDYVSAEAINKRILGNYKHYKEFDGTGGWVQFNNQSAKLFGKDQRGDLDWNGAYAQGFMKGMDIEPSDSNLGIFKDFVAEYIRSDTKLPHWSVTVGQFLK